MRIAGVDGCRDGWVVAWEPSNEASVRVDVISGFAEIIQRTLKLVVVDIPIGLLDNGVRQADREARKLLKRRASCVFNAPLRGMLDCMDHQSACELGRRTEGKAISKQTWAIIPKIKQVDAEMIGERQSIVKEGHPEVSFARMNEGVAIPKNKKTREGREARLQLLEPHFPLVRAEVEKHSGIREDVIDALAMLWTARRIEAGTAVALPEISPKESRGLLMQIWV